MFPPFVRKDLSRDLVQQVLMMQVAETDAGNDTMGPAHREVFDCRFNYFSWALVVLETKDCGFFVGEGSHVESVP